MTLIQHRDENIRFSQQVDNAREYLIPFIDDVFKVDKRLNILEIGCGDGGVLLPFLEMGCQGIGIELVEERAENAKRFLSKYIDNKQVEIINLNIYAEAALERFKGKFDLILLKDVIEHIHDQEKLIPYLKEFLTPNGRIYFGFPPWYMPHGGHQQICSSKILTVLPYFHLLPMPLYKLFLKAFGERADTIEVLCEIKTTGISIERFEKIVKGNDFVIEKKTHYLINPIYKFKFGWAPRQQFKWISNIPFFRNFATTCVYYLIKVKN
jgi:SAM-dependent methyltransferase